MKKRQFIYTFMVSAFILCGLLDPGLLTWLISAHLMCFKSSSYQEEVREASAKYHIKYDTLRSVMI